MKTVTLLLVLVGCLLGYNGADASALADLEQSCGPINISYEITAIATLPGSGKVVLAGFYINAEGYKQLFVGRENAAGDDLDLTFGKCYYPTASTAPLSGYTILGNDSDSAISATANWIPTAVIIDAAHNIVVVGTYQDALNLTAPQQGFIARFTSAGALDTTFGSSANPTQGYNLFSPANLNLPATNPITPISFNNVIEHIDGTLGVGVNISRYVIVGSGNPQGIVVAIQDGGATDGQLDTTFGINGVFAANGTVLGGAVKDSVVFNSVQYYKSSTFINYYVAGSVKTSGILLALSIITGINTTPTTVTPTVLNTGFGKVPSAGGSPLGYILISGDLLGGTAGSSVVFNELIQSRILPSATPNGDWYIIGQIGGNTAFLVSIVQAGSFINGAFNNSAIAQPTFGKTPGVMIISSSQLGQTGTVQFSSLIQQPSPSVDNSYYISGVAGGSSFIVSVVSDGTGFNPGFGVGFPASGFITLSYTQAGLLEAPNITQALWDQTASKFYLLSSDTSDNSPGVRSSVAKIVADGSALDITYNGAGTVPGVTASFIWSWNYVRNTNIAGAFANINVTIVQTPVGQAIQLLAPTDNPLFPPISQQILIPGFVFDMTNCVYVEADDQIIIVGVLYIIGAGAGATNAYIARFNSDLTPDTSFGGIANPAGGFYGYKNFDASNFGGAGGDPALFFSVLPTIDNNNNYTVAGSVNVGAGVYDGLIAQIRNDGTGIATGTATFKPGVGFKTYTSANLGGIANNAVLTGILLNTNYYVIGMTDVITSIAVPSLNSAPAVNPGNGVIANINSTTGAINAPHFAIVPTTFGLNTAGANTQLCSFIQNPLGDFIVAVNLPDTQPFGGGLALNRAGVCAVLPGLTGLDTARFGAGGTGYTVMTSSTFGVAPAGINTFLRFEIVQLLTNNDLLLLGKIIPTDLAFPLEEQTLVVQMKSTGIFNQRLNGTGYLLGSLVPLSKQGTMTNYSENVISIVGVDGGIFVFGSGVASGTSNLVEIALIKRYGL